MAGVILRLHESMKLTLFWVLKHFDFFLKYGGNIFSYKDSEHQIITIVGILNEHEIKISKKNSCYSTFFNKEEQKYENKPNLAINSINLYGVLFALWPNIMCYRMFLFLYFYF